jgi:hypothetical protein
MFAARACCMDLVELLLERGAVVSTRDTVTSFLIRPQLARLMCAGHTGRSHLPRLVA